MGRKRLGGYLFVWWRSDHPPRHVHVYDSDGRLLGRVRVDTLEPLDRWVPPRKVRDMIERLAREHDL